jgi:hypothetical protein
MKNGVIVLLAFGAAASFVLYVNHIRRGQEEARLEIARHDAERAAAQRRPEVLHVTPDVSVHVAASVVPNAEYLCSKCYHAFPASKMHVVPTQDEQLGAYVGSYRCDEHWKAAVAETRARIAADASVDEVGGMLQVLTTRGVPKERLRSFTAEKSPSEASFAVLDALERGALVIPLQ